MPLYEVTDSGLTKRPTADFAALQMYERQDLQRLLRDEIGALGDDLMVVSEEFGYWEDARRRIDLLAIDRTGRLVVIEIKRTDDGGHIELQAIRYAAMVSSMGFSEVVEAYTAHRTKHRPQEEIDPQAELESFLEAAEVDDRPVVSTDVRILLVSADFGREITTAVLWLNGFEGMDIRCIRLVPYKVDDKVLLDIQQVIPLPEAADYQVQLRKKGAARERAHRDGRDFTRFHIVVDGTELPDENKRNAMRVLVEQLIARGVRSSELRDHFPASKWREMDEVVDDPDEVSRVMLRQYPQADLARWFVEYPFTDSANGTTFVLSKMWGRKTEAKLKALAESFPETKVTFRPADPSG